MAKSISCKSHTIGVSIDGIREAIELGGKEAAKETKYVDDYAQQVGNYAWEKNKVENSLQRGEVMSIGMEALTTRITAREVKGMDEEFIARTQLLTTAKKGTPYEREAINAATMNQHPLAVAYGRIAGQIRSFKGGKTKNVEGQLSTSAAPELVARTSFLDGIYRTMGIPATTIKATAAGGIAHIAHITAGDALRVIFKSFDNGEKVINTALQASKNPNYNIQFQNLAEAARVVIEHGEIGKKFDAEGIVELQKKIKTALITPQGTPINKKSKDALDEAMRWASKTADGKAAVKSLVEALSDPKVINDLGIENRKMMAVHAILSRADGVQMATQAIDFVKAMPSLSERVIGYGQILFEGGLAKIFGKDPQSRLTVGQLNVTFAEQNFMQAMSKLDDATILQLKTSHENLIAQQRAKAKNAKTGGKGKRKEGNSVLIAQKAKQTQEADANAAALGKKRVEEDPEARATGLNIEEASLIQKEYIKATYGPIVGGWVKLQGAISNKVAMGGEIATRLVGLEHHYLLNATEYTAVLAKLVENNPNLTSKDYLRIFQAMQKGQQLAGDEAKVQKQLEAHIDLLFGLNDSNKLAQDGIVMDEFVFALGRVGLTKYADEFAAGEDLLAFNGYWRKMEFDAEDNVIEILSKFYAAKEISQVRPHMAATLVSDFSHKSLSNGLTLQEAIDKGWKEISPDTFLGQLLFSTDPKLKVLFPPEIIEKMRGLNHYLDYERGFKGNAAKFWQKLDPVVSFLKASNTIWRPGHHAVSTLGNMMVNTVAGVSLRDYGYAIELLRAKGDVVEDITGLEGIIRRNIPEGYKFEPSADGVPFSKINAKTGKVETFKLSVDDVNRLLDGEAGVRITPHQAKDIVADEATGAIGKRKSAVVRGVSNVDHKIAQFAATRDNLFRYALFAKALRTGGPFNKLDEAVQYAAQQVHEFHPTVGTLSGWERKNARRAFYFYTWQKQMLAKMLEMAANQPAVITIPSKMQFAIAEMGGLNPNSFGDPHDPQSMYASYNSNSVYGPQWKDDTWGAMGIKPSAPQLDVFDSILTKFQTRPQDTLLENIGNLTIGGAFSLAQANASPLFKIPAELATGNRFNDMGKIQMDQEGLTQYALDQTSLGSLARWTNVLNTGGETAYDEANRARQATNYLFGLRQTFYESPASLAQGRQEELDYWQKTYKVGKYYEGK